MTNSEEMRLWSRVMRLCRCPQPTEPRSSLFWNLFEPKFYLDTVLFLLITEIESQ